MVWYSRIHVSEVSTITSYGEEYESIQDQGDPYLRIKIN